MKTRAKPTSNRLVKGIKNNRRVKRTMTTNANKTILLPVAYKQTPSKTNDNDKENKQYVYEDNDNSDAQAIVGGDS